MAVYFFDSSGVVKRYVNETGTAWVVDVTDPATGNHLYIARITGVEVVSAVTRRARSNSLSIIDSETALADFRYDFAHQYRIVEVTPSLIENAMALTETHALRGYDAVQLAAALEVNALHLSLGNPTLILVSADTELNTAATSEGLMVEDPNLHL